MLIDDIYREYLYEIKSKNYTERTIKGYKNNLAKFFKYCKEELELEELEEITHIHIKKYLNYLNDKGLSSSYINTILKNVRSFYNYCYAEEYCINVAKKLSWLKEKKTIISTFTDAEIRKMLDYYKGNNYLNVRNKTLIWLFVDTGLRNFEVCNLKRTDVRESIIFVANGKGNKERVVPISPMLKKQLIKYERIRDAYLKDSLLHYDNYFLSFYHKPLTVEAIERVVKLAGEGCNVRDTIRCSPHTLRHYYSQTQLKNGLDVYSLSRLLGHSKIATTQIYLNSMRDAEIVDKGIKTSPLMNL